MVSIFTGLGSGFERGSLAQLGAGGLLGSGAFGRSGEQLSLNAATGNFLISQRDEFLTGSGPDSAIARTYNSLGNFSDDNGDNWRQSTDRRVYGLTGTLNTAGSTVTRVSGDGSAITYTYQTINAVAAYWATSGSGAHDKLVAFGNGASSNWTWTDGGSQNTEVYSAYDPANPSSPTNWRITTASNTNGLGLTFSYNGALLDKVTTANGEYEQYVWSGGNITQITTGYKDLVTNSAQTLTRTRYGYDTSNRLTTVTVDLSPEDNSVADGNAYVATYTYDGTSKRVATITETDGSQVAIGYDGSGRVTSLTQTVATGVTRLTSIAYNTGYTTITDPLGQVTRLDYDANDQLTGITAPPATSGADPQVQRFVYDANGNVTDVTDAFKKVTHYTYDAMGNVLTVTDPLGNVTTRTYGSMNELLTETHTAAASFSSTGNLGPDLTNGAQWSSSATRSSTTFAGGGAAYLFTATDNTATLQGPGVAVNPGDTITYELTLQGYGSTTSSAAFQVGSGAVSNTTYEVVSGPGSFATPAGGWVELSGLSVNATTRIRVTRQVTTSETEYFWLLTGSASSSTLVGQSLIIGNPSVVKTTPVAAPPAPTTRYVYDGRDQLTYTISAEGRVTHYFYNSAGGVYQTWQYTAQTYDVSGLAASTALTTTDLLKWENGIADKSTVAFTYNYYDARGNLTGSTSSGIANAAGSGLPDQGYTYIQYTYDQAGQLRNRTTTGLNTEYFLYDGLGRLTASTDLNNATTHIAFNDASTQTVVTLANGLVKTTTYNKAGEVISTTDSLDTTSGNLLPDLSNPSQWGVNAGTVSSGATLNGVAANTYTSTGDSITLGGGGGGGILVAAGDTLAFEFTIKGSGSNTAASVFLVGTASQYGAPADVTFQILSGPGTIVSNYGSGGEISGLTSETRVRITQHFNTAQNVYINVNAGLQVSPRAGKAIVFGQQSVVRVSTPTPQNQYDADGQLRIYTDRTGRQSYFVYDQAGRKVADVDQDGDMVEYQYDADNRLVGTVRYGGVVSSPNIATYLQNPASTFDLATIRPASDQADLWSWKIYDADDRVAETIDGSGDVTTYQYDGAGRQIGTTSYANKLTSTELAWLKTAPAGLAFNRLNNSQLDGTSGWGIGYNPSNIVNSGSPYAGVSSGKSYIKTDFTATAGGQVASIATYEPWFSVTAGERLAVQAGVEGQGAIGTLMLTVWWRDVNGNTIGSSDIGTLTGAQAFNTKISGFATAPAGAVVGRLEVYMTSSAAGTGSFDLAEPMVSQATATQTTIPTFTPLPAADSAHDSVSRVFYDKDGLVVGTLDGEGYLTQTIYDAAGRKIQQTAFANPSAPSLTTNGTITQVVHSTVPSSADRTTRYVYDGQSELRFVIDSLNHVTEYGYRADTATGSEIGDVRTVTRYATAIATPATWTLAGVQAVLSANAASDRASYAVYDAANRLAYAIDASGAVTGYSYDGLGQLIKTTQFKTLSTATSVPALSAMASWATTTDDRVTRTAYDQRGRVAYTMDGEGYITGYTYDAENRVVGTTRWDVAVATTLTTLAPPTSGGSTTTATTYDNEGRVATTTDGQSVVTKYFYNANGTLGSTVVAPNTADQVQTSFTYDGAGRKLSETDAFGAPEARTMSWTYDGLGDVISVKDPNGNITTSSYDRLGRKRNQTDPLGGVTAWQYDAFGDVIATTDARHNTSYSYYDQLGRVIATRDAENYVTETAYTVFGEVLSVTRRANATTQPDTTIAPVYGTSGSSITDTSRDAITKYEYDNLGRLKKATDALGNVTTYGLTTFGQRQTATSALGTITTSSYDRRGLLKSQVVDSVGGGKAITSSFSYDALGRQTQAIDPMSHASSVTYDRDGRVIQSTDALSNVTTYTYDRRGNLVWVQDALGNVTRRAYDQLDRLVYTVDALGDVTKNIYDANGNVIAIRAYATPISPANLANLANPATAVGVGDIAALVTSSDSADELNRSVYDADGRLRYTVDPGNYLTEYDYDAGGNVIRRVAYTTAITSAATYTIATVQTQIAAMSSQAIADARITRNIYSAEGKLTYTIDALGDVTAYTHDAFGNTVKQQHVAALYTATDDPSDAAMTTWLGTNGNATNDRISRAIYDQDGQLRFTVDAEQFVTQYTYDAVGNVRFTTRYAEQFDASHAGALFTDGTTLAQALANVANTSSTAAAVTERQYDSAGRLWKTIDAAGTVTLLTLDQLGRAITTEVASGTPDASVTTRVFDALGRVISVTRAARQPEASTTSSRYDALGRLTGTLDGNGSVQLAALFASPNPAPTQAAIDAVYATYGTTYSYDANGNALTTSVALDATSTAVTTKTYDAFGNVVKLVDPRNNAGYFYYDALNRLILQIDPEGYATATSYTASGKIASVTRYAARPNGTPTVTTRPTIVYTPGSDAVSSFIYDKLDRVTSTTQLVDSDPLNNVVESYHYNAFGDRDKVTNKLGSVTNNSFDKRGLLLSETMQVDQNGVTITNRYTYDARGNKISVIEAYGLPEQRITTYDYYLTDLVKTKTGDAVPVQNANNIGSTDKPVIERYQYDRRGNLIQVTDANGASSFFFYDDLDRKSAEISAVGTLTTRVFDASGNIKVQRVYATTVALPTAAGGTPPAGTGLYRETRLIYDRNNRLTTTVITGLNANNVIGVQYGEYDKTSGNYNYDTTDIITSTGYDLAGNAVVQTDGRGNSSYSYYNKLGQKTAQVDAENYLTSYALDQNGNVMKETRYATRLTNAVGTGTGPNPPASSADDRITDFTYDLLGRRTSESRENVVASTVGANGALTTTSGTATITYSYNGLGQVLQKTEANGDYTKQGYDLLGRAVHSEQKSFVDYRGILVTPSTDTTYNGLGEVVTTTVHGDTSFTNGTTPDRVTTNQYGKGGRLTLVTDPTGFATSYFYDNAGNVVAQTYARLKADGTSETDGTFIAYDAAGRETSRKAGVLSGGTWTYGDTTDDYYDAYGEVVARGTNSGGNIAYAQEFAEYDNAGRVWRTNFSDGVTKAYAYDRSGNATLLLQGNAAAPGGPANLKGYPSLDAILADKSGAITQTISVFDKRGQLTDTIQPASNNAGANPIHAVQVDTTGSAGTISYNSSANPVSSTNAVPTGAVGGAKTSSTVIAINKSSTIQTIWSEYCSFSDGQAAFASIVASFKIKVPLIAEYGSGGLHVFLDGSEISVTKNAISNDSIELSSSDLYFYSEGLGYSTAHDLKVYQDVPNFGGALVLLSNSQIDPQLHTQFNATTTFTATTTVTPKIIFENESPSATNIRMFVRPAGSTGAYSECDAAQVKSKDGAPIAGWYALDLTQPPFNGMAANSGWDIKYLAMDAAGNIYDAKQGNLSVDASGKPGWRFDPVAVGGPGQAMLTNGNGRDLLVLSGLQTSTTGRIMYRAAGSNNAWSVRNIDSAPAFGQQGLMSVDVTGLGGPIEYWVEQFDANGNLLQAPDSSGTLRPARSSGTFTVGGQASTLTQFTDGSRAIQLNPPSGVTVTSQQFRYFQNGAWSAWIVHSGGGSWTYDAVALADFYSDRSYAIQYETYNGSTLLSHADGTLNLGYSGQSVSGFTNALGAPAKVVFTPQQASATRLVLYWRDQGSTGAFSASTITKVDGMFAWDIDADPAHPRPTSGTRTLEYYYDAYAADNSVLPPLNGDDHVRGSLVLATDHYTNPQNHEVRWVIDTKAASQYLIHRSQNYNAFGEISSEVDGKAATTSLFYDTLGKLTKKVSPQVQVTDEAGNSTLQSPTETYFYDLSGRVIGKQDANSNLLSNGPVATATLLAGSGHGGSDPLTLIQYNPDGTKKALGYDIFGNLRTSTDELGAVTQNSYDKAGRLIEVDHPTRVGGNSPGLQLKDYYSYDGLGERITHSNNSPDDAGLVEKTDYDARGRITKVTDFGGLSTSYTYSWYGIAGGQLVTTGLGNYGGWQTTITNAANLTSIEKDGLFGQVTWRQDFGGNTSTYTYDLTGHLRQQTGSTGQSVSFTYYANGYVASITDNTLKMQSTFEYDSEGNRTLETYNSTDAAPRFYQNASVTYDAMGRITEFKDAKADITYKYDANGNRREVKSVYNDGVGGAVQTQDYWYKYDSMNRFVLTMGTLSGGVITTGPNGVAITYDAAGNRKTATYGYDNHTETYSYTTDGFLENTTIAGVVRASRTNDVLGRVTRYAQFNASGGTDLTRAMTYDRENRVTDETDVDATNGNVTTTVHNDYRAYVAGAGYTGTDQGVLIHTQSVQGTVTTQTDYAYQWWDEAKQIRIKINATDPSNPNTGQWAGGYSQLTYDANGHLAQAYDNALNRVMTYQNDAYGQVLVREEKIGGALGPRQLYYYFDGHRIGDVGNNGPSPSLTDYAQALALDRSKPVSKNGFRTGQPVASADFDENFQPINGSYPDQAGSTYTVRSGDTLQTIAQAVWGDASLWYLIADANGLTASTALVANQTLSIPNKVTNFHNNTNTFRVYNPGEAIGDTLPTLPVAPAPPAAPAAKSGCGVFGQILLIVIAVAVTIASHGALAHLIGAAATPTAAATGLTATLGVAGANAVGGALAAIAGSVVSQAVGVATGIQSSFSWKGVALAAIGGAVGGALQGVNAFGTGAQGLLKGLQTVGNDAVRGALGSAISQGIGVVTGLQHNFDWAGVAAAGIGAAAGGAVGRSIGFDTGLKGLHLDNALKGGVAGAADAIANAATRSLINGSDFGDNVVAALPSVIGNTIGSLVGNSITGSGRTKPRDTVLAPGAVIPAADTIQPAAAATQNSSAAQPTNPDFVIDRESGDVIVLAPRTGGYVNSGVGAGEIVATGPGVGYYDESWSDGLTPGSAWSAKLGFLKFLNGGPGAGSETVQVFNTSTKQPQTVGNGVGRVPETGDFPVWVDRSLGIVRNGTPEERQQGLINQAWADFGAHLAADGASDLYTAPAPTPAPESVSVSDAIANWFESFSLTPRVTQESAQRTSPYLDGVYAAAGGADREAASDAQRNGVGKTISTGFAYLLSSIYDFALGGTTAVGSTPVRVVEGVTNTIQHPINTAAAWKNALLHPNPSGWSLKGVSPFRAGYGITNGAVDTLMLVDGVGEMSALRWGRAAETTAIGEGAAGGRQVLYHYTNEAGVQGIADSNSLNPSLWKVGTKDVRYGNGQYVSDIVPGTRTPSELSRDFLGQPFQGSRFTHYVEIDATGLGAVQGRAGVYVIPNEAPLDLTGRLLSSGKVPGR